MLTVVFAVVALVAASFIIFEWGGADMWSGQDPAWWAVPGWAVVTLVLLVVEAFLVRAIYRAAARRTRESTSLWQG